ncbi:MAG: DUF4112 domain-containing protein [Rhodospirillales bacterium]|nr:DUF4112 domain-containing protein [Rhodospirillales bacterium]
MDAIHTSNRHHARIRRLERLAELLDDRFRIPGTRWRFGLDSLIGLVPGVGDAAGAIMSAYIIAEAARLGLPKRAVLRMLANLGIDTVLGAVPLAGDLFDVAYKSNRRNVNIALDHLKK